jgi:hypothetical protein
MEKFQAQGGFSIPTDQRIPWGRSYMAKREDAFEMAIKKYLDTRTNNFTPKPGELMELYKNSVTEIDRTAKAQEPPQDMTPTVPIEEVKKMQNTIGYDVWPRVVQRAHNLCKRWQGFTSGYDDHGRINGQNNFGKYTGIIDEAIKAQYGDPKTVVENEAFNQVGKYSGITIPPVVRARCQV